MRIIIEGPDGAGKTTLVRQLAQYFGCDILSMTEYGSKNYEDYVTKAKLNNVISDRSFLSEMIYTNVFDRKSKLSLFEYEKLLNLYKDNGWCFIILNAKKETLLKRLQLRGDEDDYKIKNILKLSTFYKALAYFYEIKMIDSEEINMDKLISELEENE